MEISTCVYCIHTKSIHIILYVCIGISRVLGSFCVHYAVCRRGTRLDIERDNKSFSIIYSAENTL